jgi:nanoRNase/pAp phosphatase (c-di-AMP/oligoRNAs hydrolase)
MSSPQQTTVPTDRDAVVEALRRHDRFLVTTHENPDGDALGSLLAMKLALAQLGKDVVMCLADGAPLPRATASSSLWTAPTRAGSARTRRS